MADGPSPLMLLGGGILLGLLLFGNRGPAMSNGGYSRASHHTSGGMMRSGSMVGSQTMYGRPPPSSMYALPPPYFHPPPVRYLPPRPVWRCVQWRC